MTLPENIDATYPDVPGSPGVKLHQQAHDTIHAAINALPGQLAAKADQSDLDAHEAAGDPHPQYLTGAEGDAAYDVLGAAAAAQAASDPVGAAAAAQAASDALGAGTAAVAAHTGLPDPHPQYILDTEKAAASGVATLDAGSKIPLAQIPASLINTPHESTGVLAGGLLSINGDTTKFNVAAATLYFEDDTNPVSPVRTVLSYAGATAVSIPGIATRAATYIGIDATGTIIQSASPFTNAQRRTIAQLGAMIHSNLTTINAVNIITQTVLQGINQLWDFMQAVGPINLSGNVYSAAGANLQLTKTAGVMFKAGSGYGVDPSAPNRVPLTAPATPLVFRYRTRTGEVTGDISALLPASYDVGGVVTAVPGTNYTIQTVVLFQSGLTRILYGQNVYANISDAQAAVITRNFTFESNALENGLVRAYIIIRNNATDLTNVAQALIVPAAGLGAPR